MGVDFSVEMGVWVSSWTLGGEGWERGHGSQAPARGEMTFWHWEVGLELWMGMSDAVEAVTGGESASMYQMRVFEIDNNGRWKIAWLIHDGWKV